MHARLLKLFQQDRYGGVDTNNDADVDGENVGKIMGFTIPSTIRILKPMPVYQERMCRMPFRTI